MRFNGYHDLWITWHFTKHQSTEHLFYAFPVFLASDYSHHLALLVSALHILLSESIQLSNLNIAHRMLSTFYPEAGNLYSLSINTANLHSLNIWWAIVGAHMGLLYVRF